MSNNTILMLPVLCVSLIGQAAVVQVGGIVASNTTWTAGNVYRIMTDVTVQPGATLTLEAGTVVKFQYDGNYEGRRCLFVNGALDARGTAGSPVVFTSERDDGVGGDSNGDGGATTPGAGDWGFVRVAAGGSQIRGCQFRYGGYRYWGGFRNYMLWVENASVMVSRCTFMNAYSVGLFLSIGVAGVNGNATANSFEACPTGIQYDSSSSSAQGILDGNSFLRGSVAIYVSRVGASLSIRNSLFIEMSSYGVQNTDSSRTVDAQHNWWGATNGPGGQGTGTGSPVSQYVTFANWWTQVNQNTQGVFNVVAQRRSDTKTVDIYYDIAGDPDTTYTVSVKMSTVGGEPYTITPSAGSLTGAIGVGQVPGTGHHIVWDASIGDSGQYTDTMRIKVTADRE